MTHQRPNHGIILQERTDALDINTIAKEFAKQMRGRLLSSDIFKFFGPH